MKRNWILAGMILLYGAEFVHAQNALSTATGVFTEDQVNKGATAYAANCASCHGSELRSTDREIPVISGKAFQLSWVGKTVGELFELVRDTMPPKEGRSLDDQVYLDIVTYVLKFNKAPAGKQMLKPDLDELKKIEIVASPG